MSSLSSSEIIKKKYRFLEVAKEVCPGFLLPNELKPVINDLFNWCMMLPGDLNPQKGLLLFGSVGAGKTTMLEIVRRFCAEVRPHDDRDRPYGFRITKAIDVAIDFNDRGYDGIRTYTESRCQAFDDLGVEPLRINYYGTAVNVLEHVIMSRYGRENMFTHITTNLSMKEIRELYGPRIYDRCREMFNIVEMRVRSFRGGVNPTPTLNR